MNVVQPQTERELPPALIQTLTRAKRIVTLTGAGISAESGLPTFRDKLTGLWTNYNPAQLATSEAFLREPDLVWGWYKWRESQMLAAKPNAGHYALAKMETQFPRFDLLTQNVDNLHERAGSASPFHLHGELTKPRCFDCGTLNAILPPMISPEPEGGRRINPPKCTQCGGLIRPGVVWFGEPLPEATFDAAVTLADACDVFLCVGTSSLVHPAAELPISAKRNGAILCIINIEKTPLDRHSEFVLRGSTSSILPLIVNAMYRTNATWP